MSELLSVQLLQAAELFHFAVIAYCFMPDHLHLLVQGADDRAQLPDFVARFKQRSGYWYRQRNGQQLWQHGYFERVLREVEDSRALCLYILANPIRAGLSERIGEYPFAGSLVYRLEELVADLGTQG